MSNEAYASLSNRVLSLEDIIRQQEQTIGVVLQRLRDVEQYAAAEARNREQAQQQLYQLMGERGGSSAEAAQQMQSILQNQNERLAALQAEVQGQAAALQGVNNKYDAALRGMEQRMQADVGGVHQRAQTGEAASMEAMRSLQAQLQGLSNATQAVDARSRDDLLSVQQQLGAELATLRQRSDNLESAIRDALRDVHGSLTAEVRAAATQHRSDLDGGLQRVNQSLEALDQRTRADMNQLHSVEQGDVNELGRRIEDLERALREMVHATTNGLASEVAQVAQHSQNLDRRQAAAHQTLLQELAKHDGQLESVDLNWRASVTDLSALVRESVAAAQQQTAAGDQALQRQLKGLEDRLTAAADTLTRSVGDLSRAMQDDCVKPLNEAHRQLSAQDQRLTRVADEYAAMQELLKTFAARVDSDAGQFKQVVEAAVRASHADLLDRINFTTAAITMQQDPETFRVEVNRALTKLWEDAKGVFLTQRSLNDVEAQLAALESAVRVELCALAERNNEVQRSVDGIRVAQTHAPLLAKEVHYPDEAQRTVTSEERPQTAGLSSSTSSLSTSQQQQQQQQQQPTLPPPLRAEYREEKATHEKATSHVSAPSSSTAAPQRSSTSTHAQSAEAEGRRRDTPADDPLPPPLPPLHAFTVEAAHAAPRQPIEEIDTEESRDRQERDTRLLRQHDSDIRGLWASLDRLRGQQAPPHDKASSFALLRMEDRAADPSTTADDVLRDAQRAASRTSGAVRDAQTAAADAGGAHRHAATAADEADAASRAARTAAAQADSCSREARAAATDAAQSVRAAEAAQNETVKVANELRVALKRVSTLETTMQRQLAELAARERVTAAAAPVKPATRHNSHSSVATVFAGRPPSLEQDAMEEVDDAHAKSSAHTLYGAEEEPPHADRVSSAAASQMASSPVKKTKSAPSPASKVADSVTKSSETLTEVPGMSTGEVFIVRQDKTDRTTPASIRPKSSFRDSLPLAPTPLKAVSPTASAAAAAKPGTPAESEGSAPPRRGSVLSEVLLPTHQFVRKREYTNFKDFTKQEIDAIWVELLNVRRNQGMSREEVLLQVSQSKEQTLNTVLQIVQRQENEMLGMLSSIKMQLLDLRSEPSGARDVKVFPIDNGKNLEELMRAISGNAPHHPSTEQTPPASSKQLVNNTVDAAKAFKTSTPSLPPRRAPASAPARRLSSNDDVLPPPLPPAAASASSRAAGDVVSSSERVTPTSARLRASHDPDADTAPSSGRSASPLIPQFIPPVVRRRTSMPSKDELTEVFFADIDHSRPPRLFSKPQRDRSSSAPHLEATMSGPLHGHLYAVAAPVNPTTVTPAARPAEPESATPQYRPTGLSAPAAQRASPKKGSRPSSAKLDAAQRLPLAPTAATSDVSPHHLVSPYVTAGEPPSQSPLPQPYKLPAPLRLTAGNEKAAPTAQEDKRRYLKEGKSPRNAAGNAFHLNPLQGMGNPQKSPPRREPGERRSPPPQEDPQESSRKILTEEPKRHDSRPPRYQLIQNTPPSQVAKVAKGASGAAPGPLKDTSPEKYQPATIRDGSDIYFESVEGQRPARRSLRRSSNSTDNTPTHAEADAARRHRGHGSTLLPEEMYNHLQQPRGKDASALRGSGQRVSAVQQQQQPQYPPALPAPQPQREYTPARDMSSNDAVRHSRSPSVQVLPSKGPIHLGPYNPPQPDTENLSSPSQHPGEQEGDLFSDDFSNAARPLSSGYQHQQQQQQHADHNPHVYAPSSGRDWDVFSTAQSLANSPSPERGNRGRAAASSAQEEGTAATPTAVAGAPVVPVRVLDAPRYSTAASSEAQPKPNSSTKIRIHPYQENRE